MKTFLFAVVFSTILAAGAIAEDNRDQAFGKHDMGPSTDSMHKSTTAAGTQGMAHGKSNANGTAKRAKSLDR
jgi:outer membrane murein-binding lipoprotein Lpp